MIMDSRGYIVYVYIIVTTKLLVANLRRQKQLTALKSPVDIILSISEKKFQQLMHLAIFLCFVLLE